MKNRFETKPKRREKEEEEEREKISFIIAFCQTPLQKKTKRNKNDYIIHEL